MKPVFLTKEQLLEVLDDMRARVEINDSYEGHIEYTMPDDGDDAQGFRVTAGYRIGNRQGQGGFRVVGDMP